MNKGELDSMYKDLVVALGEKEVEKEIAELNKKYPDKHQSDMVKRIAAIKKMWSDYLGNEE
jgi:hypothetical protein